MIQNMHQKQIKQTDPGLDNTYIVGEVYITSKETSQNI
jgi:hypothetical protein